MDQASGRGQRKEVGGDRESGVGDVMLAFEDGEKTN